MQFDFYQLTSPGDRKTNQDYMANIIQDDYALFVVADGLGGHQAGERASGYFCKGLLQLAPKYSKMVAQEPEAVFEKWIDSAIDEMSMLFAGDRVAEMAHTTCAILYIQDNLVLSAHCGDSRVYRLNYNEILWRTRDHSITQKLFDEGEVSEREMGFHPEQNRLTRSINVLRTHSPEISLHGKILQGETFILCTDGFWEFIKPEELLKLAQKGSGRADLIKQAKLSYLRAQGKSDNLTVQWVRLV